ncbi:Retinol dehydrogenase 11 [Chionoecetes opilio]|uniref:Retinol dehydrogenase 11 n=1 Tax=Chionoecetes opilio TaxID=41210 RepID=A0A8J4Y6D5_CHIOP|nr:Retinol dehydrogenase 11 [Chionoecetes opilio]
MELDLGDLASVRTFSAALLGKFDHLDVLINNAGVYVPPEDLAKTKDGFEVHFGVNHLGHFLLTLLLLPRLQDTPGARWGGDGGLLAVQVWQDRVGGPAGEKGWDTSVRNALYSNSKLANVMHSQELARRTAGSSVRAFALCPGFVSTGLFRHSQHRLGLLRKVLFAPVLLLFMRNAKQVGVWVSVGVGVWVWWVWVGVCVFHSVVGRESVSYVVAILTP